MKYFIKVTLAGIVTCIMSALTMCIGYGAICFMKEAFHSYGIEAIVLFIFSLLLVTITVLVLFMDVVIPHMLLEQIEDCLDVTPNNKEETVNDHTK